MKRKNKIILLIVGVALFGLGFSPFTRALSEIQLLYRVQDEVLSQTSMGRYYIWRYYSTGAEISGLLAKDPELTSEAIETLQLWEPNLRALVDGKGYTAIITGEQLEAVLTFLNHLYTLASPQLQEIIAGELSYKPLEQTIGMSMDEAWAYLNSFPVEMLPPASWANVHDQYVPVGFIVIDKQGNLIEDPSFNIIVLGMDGDRVYWPVRMKTIPLEGGIYSVGDYNFNVELSNLPPGTYLMDLVHFTPDGVQSVEWTINQYKLHDHRPLQ